MSVANYSFLIIQRNIHKAENPISIGVLEQNSFGFPKKSMFRFGLPNSTSGKKGHFQISNESDK